MNSYIILFCLQNSNPEIQFFPGLSQPVNRAASTTDFIVFTLPPLPPLHNYWRRMIMSLNTFKL